MILQHFLFPSQDFNPAITAFFRPSKAIAYSLGEQQIVFPCAEQVDFDTYFNAFTPSKWVKYTSIKDASFRLHLKGAFIISLYNKYRDGGKTISNELSVLEMPLSTSALGEANHHTPLAFTSDVKNESGHNEVPIADVESGTSEECPPANEEKDLPSNASSLNVLQALDTCTDELIDIDTLPMRTVEISIPLNLRGICSIRLVALEENATFLGGEVYTTSECEEANAPRIAIDICTYQREAFVQRNMEILRDTIFASDSPLKDRFEVFIADNASSLLLPDDYNGKVHIYPNINAGGAGGFGRSMIEILQSPNYPTFTHILMMDDDIVFSHETLWRTWHFVSLLKPEYKGAFLGGAMLSLDNPALQTEAFERWYGTAHAPLKYRYNITSLDFVIKNEIEDKGNYFGWWYCLMPIGVVKANNLPLPLFIKRDDVEYGIRNGQYYINLNGICVLHSDFAGKRRGFLEYYYWRNLCIINAIHWPSYTGKTLKKQLFKLVVSALWRYRYNDVNLAFVGVEDFLRGVDWLVNTDPVALNTRIMKYTYRPQPAQELSEVPFVHGLYEETKKKTAKNSPIVKDTIGTLLWTWLHPSTATVYVPMANPPLFLINRAKKLVNYDESSNTAFVTRKSIRCAINLLANYYRICRLINKHYNNTVREYRFRFRELTSLPFWKRYLKLTPEVSTATETISPEPPAPSVICDENTLLANVATSKSYRKDRLRLWQVRLYRFVQHLLWVIPYRPKSVAIYLHARKGYTCNPKYILEELLTRFGAKITIDWITDWPETVSSLTKRGVNVIRLNSFQHWWRQFTARVVITNDCFPLNVHIRHRQLTINTWHAGMNYKHIGPAFCSFRNKARERMFAISNSSPKIYLSGSQFFTQDTAASFKYKSNIFKPTGLPRNDIFFRDTSELTRKIRERYAIPTDVKLVLYAPTFRDGFAEEMFNLDFIKLRQVLSERFGGKWYVLYRKHYFIGGKGALLDNETVNVSDYDDMNELLAVSDVLISDYSSCLWDFALTKRPSFVYAPDLDHYVQYERAFAYPIEKWPFAIVRNNEELFAAIRSFDQDTFSVAIQRHLNEAGGYDTGTASKQVVDMIAKHLSIQ